jgi:hypothetical protein
VLVATIAAAGSANLPAIKDNSMWSEDSTLSNGVGEHLYSGRTNFAGSRRALLAFDIAGNIPAGATITSATLTLHVSKSPFSNPADQTFAVYRLLADWGESTSNAFSPGGAGAQAEPGDVTWSHRFFNTDAWTTAGGDFAALASATTSIPQSDDDDASWSGAALVADVQLWLDSPAANFGWIVIGPEGSPTTARRFDSRENITLAFRPVLAVEYDLVVSGAGAVPNGDTVPGTALSLGKALGGDLDLDWDASCRVSDTDYAVYEGLLGSFASHVPVVCTTLGATSATITPMPSSAYYLVVPLGGGVEGSYGTATGGGERGQGGSTCASQSLAGCP